MGRVARIDMAGRLQLEGRVLDVEVRRQAALQARENLARTPRGDRRRVNDDVRREHGSAASELPHVDVVHGHDIIGRQDVVADLRDVGAFRRGLREHVEDLPEQPDRAGHDESRDQE